MTIYEINYRNRLEQMLDTIIRKYGHEHRVTIFFAGLVDKYINVANYHNRETMEKYFKKFIKNA